MQRKEGQIQDGIGWKMKRGKKVWFYLIYVRIPGVKKLKKLKASGFATQSEALNTAVRARHLAEIQATGLIAISARPTLAELIARRVATITPQSEQTRAKRILTQWVNLLPDGFQVQAVETEHIRPYVEARQAQGVSAATIDRDLNIVAATLNAAGEFFSSLKQWKTPKIPRPKVDSSRRSLVITDDQYERIIAALTRSPDSRDGSRANKREAAYQARLRVSRIFRFALLSGCRHSEIMKLKWTDVESNRVLVYQTKTKKYKQIPMTDSMAELIEECRVRPLSTVYVFGESGKIYPKFYRILRAACELADVPYGLANDGIVLHTARHTVTTKLVQAGHDLDTVGAITGHSAKELILHYSHHSPATLARAAEALENVSQKVKRDKNGDREVEQISKKEHP